MRGPDLVRLIETHADKLTHEYIEDIKTNPNTPFLRQLPYEDLSRRIHNLYFMLGRWLAEMDEQEIEERWAEAAKRLHGIGAPLSEVVLAVLLAKQHLWNYLKRNQLVDSILDLYQFVEVVSLVSHYFDRAIYHTVSGYEKAHGGWKEPRLLEMPGQFEG